MFDQWIDPQHWFKKRDDYMKIARATRAALCNQRMSMDCKVEFHDREYHFPPEPLNTPLPLSDPKVKKSVGIWVAKARHYHSIAMKRRPLIQNFIFLTGSDCSTGPLYVRR